MASYSQGSIKKHRKSSIFAKKDALLVTFGEFSVLFGTFLPSFLAQKCNSPINTSLSVSPTTPFSKFFPKNLIFHLFHDYFTPLLFFILSPVFCSQFSSDRTYLLRQLQVADAHKKTRDIISHGRLIFPFDGAAVNQPCFTASVVVLPAPPG